MRRQRLTDGFFQDIQCNGTYFAQVEGPLLFACPVFLCVHALCMRVAGCWSTGSTADDAACATVVLQKGCLLVTVQHAPWDGFPSISDGECFPADGEGRGARTAVKQESDNFGNPLGCFSNSYVCATHYTLVVEKFGYYINLNINIDIGINRKCALRCG